jgi:hypothetical protein
MKQFIRLLIPIVTAVALGPLIAGLAVCLLMVVGSIFGHISFLPIGNPPEPDASRIPFRFCRPKTEIRVGEGPGPPDTSWD